MPPVQPLPSGEGSPSYYERMFGDRIRDIAKPSNPTPPSQPSPQGSGWNGGALVGVIIAVVLGISRITSHTRSDMPSVAVPTFHRIQVNRQLHPWPEANAPAQPFAPPARPRVFPPHGEENLPVLKALRQAGTP
jgi:hypothetical protein